MLHEYITGIALIFTFLFISSQLFKKEMIHPAASLGIKIKIGLVQGIMSTIMMFFSVNINETIVFDLRNIFIIIAAYMGGMFSAILAALVIIISRNLFFDGVTQAALTAAISVMVVAVGTGFISGWVRHYWTKWLYNYFLTAVVVYISIIYTMGPFSSLVLPYLLGIVFLGCAAAASFLRFITNTYDKTNLNKFITHLSSKLYLSDGSQKLLEVTLKELAFLFSIDFGSVIITDQNQYRVVLNYSNGTYEQVNHHIEPDDLEALSTIYKGHAVLFSEWSKRRPQGSGDLIMYDRGVRSSLHLPILYKGRVISIINLGSKKNGYFGPREVSISLKLAPLLSLAIAFKDAEGRFASVFDSSLDAIIVLSSDNYIVMWNEGAERLYQYTADEMIGQHVSLLIPTRFHDILKPKVELSPDCMLNRHINKTVELVGLRKDGTEVSVEVSWNGWQTGGSRYISTITRDTTQRKQNERELQESEERYRRLIELLPDGVLIHTGGAIVMANPKAAELLCAASPAELLRYPVAALLHPDSREIVTKHNQDIYETKGAPPPSERVYIRLDGHPIHVEASSTWIAYNGNPSIMVAFRDITARKTAEQKLYEANEIFKKLSTVDGLTGIANRRCLEERYDLEWNQALNDSTMLSILIMDIDSFKLYNDTYGHQGGDACLKQVAAALDELATTSGHFAARFGGEEFICILPQTSIADAISFAMDVRTTIEMLGIPHLHSPFDNKVTVSVGVAGAVPAHYMDKKELIEHADKAMYQAKLNGRNQVSCYSET